MPKVKRTLLGGIVIAASLVALLAYVNSADVLVAQEVEVEVEVAPPAGQTFTGAKSCASCHFDQFITWKKTKHAKAFDDLTAKYQADEKCLKCHTTGFGEATGYKDQATTATLAGITCESCHGPGSKHEEIAQQFAKVKTLTPEQEKVVRDSIWMVLPQNICIGCHVVQAHKESPTPPELRKAD